MTKGVQRRGRFFWLALFWAALLFYLHVLPGDDLLVGGWWLKYHMDKVAHAGMFSILYVLLFFHYKNRFNQVKRSRIMAGLVIVFYGAILEWIQGAFIPGRITDLWDFFADIAGIPVGIVIIALICRKSKSE